MKPLTARSVDLFIHSLFVVHVWKEMLLSSQIFVLLFLGYFDELKVPSSSDVLERRWTYLLNKGAYTKTVLMDKQH